MIWLIAAAVAQGLHDALPEPPVRGPDHTGDCQTKEPALAGSKRKCDALSVPPAYLAFLEENRVYASQLHVHLVAAHAVADADARAAADQIAWRDERLAEQAELRQPNPTLEVLGYVGIGVVMTLGAAWSLGQIAQFNPTSP